MPGDSRLKQSRWVSSLALAYVIGTSAALLPARAQDGVAGAPPVFSKPQKEPPKGLSVPKEIPQIRVQSILVTAPVTVLDSAGEFVYDLGEADFQVFDNGVPQRIERFEPELRSLAAVILVQTNHAVAPLLDHVRPLGSVFSGLMLGPNGQAAVVTFDDRVRVEQEFTNDSDRLDATLKKLAPRGDQARLNDALARAIALLEKRPKAERRVVVAFSDGFDKGSESTQEEIARQATHAEVAIYGLGFSPLEALLVKKPEAPQQSPLDTNVTRPLPPNVPPTPTRSENVYGTPVPVVSILIATGQIIRSSLASSLLEFYAGYTGGVFHTHWTKKGIQDQLSRIAADIHSQYELAYVPDTLNQTGFHRIEVQVRRPGVKVRTRAGYFYTGPNP